MRKIIITSLLLIGIVSYTFAQEEDVTNAAKNLVYISGDTFITADSETTVLPMIVDQELHNRASLLRAIGVPLYDSGKVAIGMAAATWLLWAITTVPALVGIDLATLAGQGSFDTSAISSALLGVSIGLTTSSIALLVSGGVTKSLGDDWRERSFTEPELEPEL